MTTPNRYLANPIISPDAFNEFECSARTTQVDLKQLFQLGTDLFGSVNKLCAIGMKLNFHGQKIKADDYVKIGGDTLMMADVLEILKNQKGYDEKLTSQGKGVSKKVLTILRISRCTAANCIAIAAKHEKFVPADLKALAIKAHLPIKYAFLSAPYGMTDEEISTHAQPLVWFAGLFESLIKEAKEKGWVTGSSERKHQESIISYITWRGFDTNGLTMKPPAIAEPATV